MWAGCAFDLAVPRLVWEPLHVACSGVLAVRSSSSVRTKFPHEQQSEAFRQLCTPALKRQQDRRAPSVAEQARLHLGRTNRSLGAALAFFEQTPSLHLRHCALSRSHSCTPPSNAPGLCDSHLARLSVERGLLIPPRIRRNPLPTGRLPTHKSLHIILYVAELPALLRYTPVTFTTTPTPDA